MHALKEIVNVASFTTMLATLVGWLPPIAALVSLIWSSICIYDWYQKRKSNV